MKNGMKENIQKLKKYLPEISFFIFLIGSIAYMNYMSAGMGENAHKGFVYFFEIMLKCVPFWILLGLIVVQMFLHDMGKILVNLLNGIVAFAFVPISIKALDSKRFALRYLAEENPEMYAISETMVRYRLVIIIFALIVIVFSVCKMIQSIAEIIKRKRKG